jgi:hypothetical protein
MGTIETSTDYEGDLTIHAVRGEVTGEEIIERLEQYYEGRPTRRNIWDFSEATVHGMSSREIRAIVMAGLRASHLHEGRRAALVLPKDHSFGLGRMYEILTELEEFASLNRAFRTMKEAREWLEVDGS